MSPFGWLGVLHDRRTDVESMASTARLDTAPGANIKTHTHTVIKRLTVYIKTTVYFTGYQRTNGLTYILHMNIISNRNTL